MRDRQRIRTVLGASLISLGASLSAFAQEGLVRNPDAEAAYEQGKALFAEEKYDAAIDAFTTATEMDDTYGEAFLGKADALRELEDYSAALQSYIQAININNESAQAFSGRGICYRELGQIDLALNDFLSAYEKDRRNPMIPADLGDLYVNYIQDPTSALRVLDKAIELDGENAEAYRNRGLAHAQLRQFEDAETDLKKSVELKDDDFETYSMQANIYLFQDKIEKLPDAITALTKAIEYYEPEDSSDPDIYEQGYLLRSDARLKLAVEPSTLEAERDTYYQQVLEDTNAVLEDTPDTYPTSGQALYRKGVALRMQGAFGKAIKALTDAIQLIPPGEAASYATKAYLKRGICWHLQGENFLARGDFEDAAALDYSDPLPHLWIGYTFAEQEDYRSAIDSYGEAIAKNPNFALPFVNRGLAYVQLGEYQRAVDNFNEAIRVEPTNADHHAKRGYVYLLMEEYEKAFNAFDLASQYDEQNPKWFLGAAEALRGLGRTALAEQYESRARELEAAGS